MKTKFYLSLLVLCALFVATPVSWRAFIAPDTVPYRAFAQTQSWNIETVDSDGDVGQYTSLALDNNGRPHISYMFKHDSSLSDLKYARWTGDSWQIQTVDTGSVGAYSSLALDVNGLPHIGYVGNGLRYAHFDGATWITDTVRSSNCYYISLELDGSGRPHISCSGGLTNFSLIYAYFNGSQWSIQTVESGLGLFGGHSSLALDATGRPHISYWDFGDDRDLKYARFSGTSWIIERVDTVGDVGWSPSLALDAAGHPHIAYASSVGLKYAYYDGTTWHLEKVTSASVGDGIEPGYIYLALDSGGRPHISYYAYSRLYYARFDDTWKIVTVDSNGDVGWSNSLALDAGDLPHISYYDITNQNLKYARMSSLGPTPTPTLTPSLTPGALEEFIFQPFVLKNYQSPVIGTPTSTATPGGPTLTPTPVPSPTATRTTTPTPVSSPTVTRTATATPSASPTSTRTATATPSSSPTSTPTSTRTPTPTSAGPTPTPPPCGINNCDFEQGATVWTEYSQNGWPLIMYASYFPETPHSGSWAAWLGGDDNEIAYLQQPVYVPSDRPYLAYWHWISSSDYCGYDFAYLRVNDTTVHEYDLCAASETNGWVLYTINLGDYVDQTVQLQIRVETDGSLYSNLFLDDFAFQSTGN